MSHLVEIDTKKHDISPHIITRRRNMSNESWFTTIDRRVSKYQEDYQAIDMGNAFQYFCLDTILRLNDEEIESALTNGRMDGQLDAIHIVGSTIHVFNFVYVTSFDKSRGNFPGTEITGLLGTMRGIFQKSIKEDDVNPLVWEKINEIWGLYESRHDLDFEYYLCSNREKPTPADINRLESELDGYKKSKYHYYDQESLVIKIRGNQYGKPSGTIKFIGNEYLIKSNGNVKGVVASVTAQELFELIRDKNSEEMKLDESAFNQNVRVYLGRENRINRGIIEGAQAKDNYIFWYLNNGITIVCDECSFTEMTSPNAKITNLQIVNGGQTVHALFDAFKEKPENVKNVRLLLRICETKDANIAEKICETTNSQTPIRGRDLNANKAIQMDLEQQFKDLGFYYERKANLYETEPKNKRLNNELLGQIYMAYYLDMPSEARDQKSLVFGEMVDKIFDERETTAERMLVPYRVYLPLEKKKKEIQGKMRKKEFVKDETAFISRGIFHLLNAVKYISEYENVDLSGKVEPAKLERKINKITQRAIEYVGALVINEVEQRIEKGQPFTPDKFFKETKTNHLLKDFIRKKYMGGGKQEEMRFESE